MKPKNKITSGGVNYIREDVAKKYVAIRLRKKLDFSKKITVVLIAFAIICVFADYTLTALGMEVPHTLTTTVLTTATIQLSGYFAKSFAEKNSRNMFGVDEYGEKLTISRDVEPDEPDSV